jgi:hypothetical protein
MGWACNGQAAEDTQRWMVERALVAMQEPVASSAPLWFFSDVYWVREQGGFSLPNGSYFLNVPDTVASAYHPEVLYPMASRYSAASPRLRWVFHVQWFNQPSLVSLGFDSGVQTEKLRLSPAVWLGMGHRWDWDTKTSLFLVGGRWFGGKLTEEPCWDTYERAYWCPNLTAWSERPAMAKEVLGYVAISYRRVF